MNFPQLQRENEYYIIVGTMASFILFQFPQEINIYSFFLRSWNYVY
jgi:hypothetical protein